MKLALILSTILFSQASFAAVTTCQGKEKNVKLLVISIPENSTNWMMLYKDGEVVASAPKTTVIEAHGQKVIAGDDEKSKAHANLSLSATADLSEGVIAYAETGKKALLDKVTCKTE